MGKKILVFCLGKWRQERQKEKKIARAKTKCARIYALRTPTASTANIIRTNPGRVKEQFGRR